MKYIKVSCDLEKSHYSLDWQTDKFYELGWELAVTHLQVKRMKSQGLINTDDVVIVSSDRSFLYENEFNVINYVDFIKLYPEKPLNFIDLTADSQNYVNRAIGNGDYANGKYKYLDQDIKLIKNINYLNLENITEPFFIIHARFRKWATERNLSIGFWKTIIEQLTKYFNLKCYVFGEGTIELTNETNVIGVNLKEYASLMNNNNCHFVVGSMSGGSMVTQLCCKDNCPVFIIKTHPLVIGNPLYHDNSINFSNSVVTFIEKTDDVFEIIKKNIKIN